MQGTAIASAETKWCSENGRPYQECSTKVEIKLTDVPEDGDCKKKIEALLAPLCDVQAYRYDASRKEHWGTYTMVDGTTIVVQGCRKRCYHPAQRQNGIIRKVKSDLPMLAGPNTTLVSRYGEVSNSDENNTACGNLCNDGWYMLAVGGDDEEIDDPNVVKEAFEIQHMLNYIGCIVDEEKSESSTYGSIGTDIDSDWN
uniref:Uncharacterized protein n=1 Tax=Oryza brachyantha TaxID=4533 RepID=J3N7Z0_ORYBR